MEQAPKKLVIWLVMATLAAAFTVSSNLLTALGSHYVSDGGLLVEKLHPSTYLAAAAMTAQLAGGGRRSSFLWSLAWRESDLVLFLATIAFCVLYALIMTGLGNLVALLDSFLPAGMLGVALSGITRADAARIGNLLRILFLTNACVALGEAASGTHLIPLDPPIPELAADFRPTALYDHPLTGSAATMLGLLLLPDPARRPFAACAYGACLFAALLVFGGRAALLLALIFMSAWYLSCLGQKVARRRVAPSQLVPLLVASVSVGAVISAVLQSGLGERLVTHLYWDPSARARLDQFQIVASLNQPQFLFGARRPDTVALIEPIRLAFGVDVLENFWLLMFVALGALCFPVFVLGILSLAHWLWRRSDLPGRMMIVAFLAAASASNSLGRKSTLLLILVACVMANTNRAPARSTLFSTGRFRSALSHS